MLLNNNGDPYIYVKKTEHPNPEYEYVITGEDYKVRIESVETYKTQFANLGGGVETLPIRGRDGIKMVRTDH